MKNRIFTWLQNGGRFTLRIGPFVLTMEKDELTKYPGGHGLWFNGFALSIITITVALGAAIIFWQRLSQ